jgi:hypothetical protein
VGSTGITIPTQFSAVSNTPLTSKVTGGQWTLVASGGHRQTLIGDASHHEPASCNVQPITNSNDTSATQFQWTSLKITGEHANVLDISSFIP